MIDGTGSPSIEVRPLSGGDRAALEALLMRNPPHNLFPLSAILERGLADSAVTPQGLPWAYGAVRDGELVGAVFAFRGTGGIYHTPGDDETLRTLAAVAADRASAGSLSLLSGHASQIEPLLSLITEVRIGLTDSCYFRTLYPANMARIDMIDGFRQPRPASEDDMERLIDFYEIGFYSLANLPSRSAWHNRLSEQLAFRTLFVVENAQGEVVSAALSSAEAGDAAMLGGVATRELYRGKGLSALCVGGLCSYLFDKGFVSVSLFYLENNAAAGRVYDKLGFSYGGKWLLTPLGLSAAFGPLLGLRTR